MRAFVAVPLLRPGTVAGGDDGSGHLTLHFLGETSEETLGRISARLPEVARVHRRFPATLEGVGAFPSTARPRVVWRDVTEGRPALLRLADDVRAADVDAGVPPDPRPFVPHVTWFRVYTAEDAGRAREILEGRTPPPAPETLDVREIQLVASLPGPGGFEHRPLGRFSLAEGQPALDDRSATSFRQR